MSDVLTVQCAAIMKHGIMFIMPRPARHGHIIRALCGVFPPPNSGYKQGFMLSDGTFATRQHAAVVAWRSAQLNWAPEQHTKLYTEDLW